VLDQVKQLMEMKRQADQMKRELDAMQVEHEERGINVVVTGAQTVCSINIDDTLVASGNKAELEKELVRCLNGAIKKAQLQAAQKMKDLMPGFPGL
jgi:DNA-binding protein YbaB